MPFPSEKWMVVKKILSPQRFVRVFWKGLFSGEKLAGCVFSGGYGIVDIY